MLSFTFTVVVALASAGAVLAAPLEKRATTQDDLNRINLFAQFAAASYCPGNNDSPQTKLACPTGNCPLVEAANVQTILEFENSLFTDVTGYVATDSTNQNVVVAFRGSQSLRNWITNVNFPLEETDLCPGCEAHQGFWQSWNEARSRVLEAVKGAADANSGFSVTVVGHSLGGAIANFAATELRNSGYQTALFTYGAPRVGSAALSNFITNQPGGNFRVTHKDDPVPRLPPQFTGYEHISPEFYITSDNVTPPTTADITVLEGTRNSDGASGDFGFDTEAHRFYTVNMSQCNPDGGFEP